VACLLSPVPFCANEAPSLAEVTVPEMHSILCIMFNAYQHIYILR